MPRPANPFKPSAGSDPPLLVGRTDLIEAFTESIDDGPGAPGRVTIFTGPRGVGKTVILNAIRERVQADYQRLVIEETATTGLIDRLAAQARTLLDAQRPELRAITGVSIAGLGGVNLAQPPVPRELGLRQVITELLEILSPHDTGLLITIDEIQASSQDDLRQFAATVQHLVREDREIAVAMAGLPSGVSELLNADGTTFLRRAERHDIRHLDLADVEQALSDTVVARGRRIEPAALAAATAATGGYPFMVQLVGYHMWRQADGDLIDQAAAQAGIQAARERLGALVHATAISDLSEVDRAFLSAMAQDDGPSHTAAIAERLAQTVSYVSVYRQRLIAAGLIAPVGRGCVDFAIPFLRQYLRDATT